MVQAGEGAVSDFLPPRAHDHSYEPDFAVETKTEKLLCEPKRVTEMDDEVVRAKARAAVHWCHHATEHAKMNGGKPWSYLLIPHDAVDAATTLYGLTASYRLKADATAS